jgi:hypothetical protein
MQSMWSVDVIGYLTKSSVTIPMQPPDNVRSRKLGSGPRGLTMPVEVQVLIERAVWTLVSGREASMIFRDTPRRSASSGLFYLL